MNVCYFSFVVLQLIPLGKTDSHDMTGIALDSESNTVKAEFAGDDAPLRPVNGRPKKEVTMSESSILLTGGAGFVGSHTVIEFLLAGYSVVVLDNLVNASIECIRRVEEITHKKVPAYNLDLLNKEALEDLFSKYKFRSVVHFVDMEAVDESYQLPLLYYKTNVGGTVNLLEVMKSFGVENLIFSSSATVYGTPQYLPLDEGHPVGGCTNPVCKTKYVIEEILMDLANTEVDWNIILLRYFNPVGAHVSGKIGDDPQGVPSNLMPIISQVAVEKRKELNVYGNDYDTPDGTVVRDYIHVVDLAKGHVAAQKKIETKCGCKIYNLGTGKGYSVLEMVKAFEKASGKDVPYKIYPRREGDVRSTCIYCSADLAKKELGWSAAKKLDDMCKDQWRWQSMNQNGFHGDN